MNSLVGERSVDSDVWTRASGPRDRVLGNKCPLAPTGSTIRILTSPTSTRTVIHTSSTSGLPIGAAWTSSSTFRGAFHAESSIRVGWEIASASSDAAGSRIGHVWFANHPTTE